MRHKDQSGFTLPELISVMAVSLLFSGLIMYFAFEYWRATATIDNNLQTFVGRLNAGDRLRDSLNASSGLIIQNSIEDSHVGDPDTSIPAGTYWTPLHATPGNTPLGVSGTATPILYFKSPSRSASKTIILNGTQPYEDEYILYLDGTAKEMRMRVLANSNAPGNGAHTTCPSGSTTSTCTIDRLIATNIESVDIRYFSRSGNLIDYTSIVDPDTGEYIGPDFPSVEVVEFGLNLFKKSTLHGGEDTTNQTLIRIALRNA
jgi:prepilin-type N-terminal cleavage/methylation domain-containing protein